MMPSPDHGAPYPTDFDGTFLSEEEKEAYIEDNREVIKPKHDEEEVTLYLCPTCDRRYDSIEEAMECCPEDVKENA